MKRSDTWQVITLKIACSAVVGLPQHRLAYEHAFALLFMQSLTSKRHALCSQSETSVKLTVLHNWD